MFTLRFTASDNTVFLLSQIIKFVLFFFLFLVSVHDLSAILYMVGKSVLHLSVVYIIMI